MKNAKKEEARNAYEEYETWRATGIDMGGKHITIFEVERDDTNATVFDKYDSTILTPDLFSSF